MYATDMSWESLGGDSFLVTIEMYRDCNGNQLSSLYLTIGSTCGSRYVATSPTKARKDVTPVCNSYCSRCDSSSCVFQYGIELYEYKTIVNLSKERANSCCLVDLTVSQCCLSASYTNVVGGNMYHKNTINLCLADGLKSPTLDHAPLAMTSLNRDVIINLGVNQSIDSLSKVVYSLIPLHVGDTSFMKYTGSYSSDNPLTYFGFPKNYQLFPRGFHLDSNSGVLKFRPIKVGISAIGIKMEQYHHGKLVAINRRFVTHICMKTPKSQANIRYPSKTLIQRKKISEDLVYHVELGSVWLEGFSASLENGDSSSQFTLTFDGPNRAFSSLSNPEITKQKVDRDIMIKWHFDSTNYKIGDTMRATVKFSAESCPFPIRHTIPLTFIVTGKKADKSKLYKTEIDSVCGRYKLMAPQLTKTGTVEWIINGGIRANGYFSDTSFTYSPLNADTQFIEVKYNTGTLITSIHDTLIPRKGTIFHLKNLPNKAYCEGDEFLHTIEFEDKNTNPSSVAWKYDTIHGNILKVNFKVNLKDSFRLVLKDSISGCKLNERIPFNRNLNINDYSFFDTIKICSNDTFSLRLPLKGKTNERWSGPGVVKRRFYRDTLEEGIHDIKYNFESEHFCVERNQTVIYSDVPHLKVDTGINVCNDKKSIRLTSNYSYTHWSGESINDAIIKYNGIDTSIVAYASVETIAGCTDHDSMNINVGARTQSSLKALSDTMVCYSSEPIELPINDIGLGSFNIPNSYFKEEDGK